MPLLLWRSCVMTLPYSTSPANPALPVSAAQDNKRHQHRAIFPSCAPIPTVVVLRTQVKQFPDNRHTQPHGYRTMNPCE
ncbi:hypothetical protein DER44DRAFT_778305 [Fusarium oxysporum]|nr:hypothetical protein DER44DRAFT_778305 [Fusarium oxysporum]